MGKIRILLVDDHTLFRQAVGKLLALESDLEVAGEASNGSEAVEIAAAIKPDLVLMDIGMPGLSAFEATRRIRRNRPATRILFLTMYDDEDCLIRAMEVGAGGYVLKDSPAQQLLAAIREIHRGGTFLSPRVLEHVVNGFRSRLPARGSRFRALTARETEVLKMIAEGQSAKEAACSLHLSVKTIEAHKSNLMRKLDIHNRAQLVQYAIQKRVIRLRQTAFDAEDGESAAHAETA